MTIYHENRFDECLPDETAYIDWQFGIIAELQDLVIFLARHTLNYSNLSSI